MISQTETLVRSLRILSEDIETDDGVVNACLAEAADRLEELNREVDRLRDIFRVNMLRHVAGVTHEEIDKILFKNK